MSEKSGPYEAGSGSFVTEDDWSTMATPWQDNGVNGTPGTNLLLVQAGASRDTLKVLAGTAQVNGFYYRNTADLVLATTKNLLDPTLPRKDLVVLNLDTTGNAINAQILVGNTTTFPTPDPATQVQLGQWLQKAEPLASGSDWGSATDARWFAGKRMRPLLTGFYPPVTIGAFGFNDSTNELVLGQDVSGTPTWVPWSPDDAHLNSLISARISSGTFTKGTTAGTFRILAGATPIATSQFDVVGGYAKIDKVYYLAFRITRLTAFTAGTLSVRLPFGITNFTGTISGAFEISGSGMTDPLVCRWSGASEDALIERLSSSTFTVASTNAMSGLADTDMIANTTFNLSGVVVQP